MYLTEKHMSIASCVAVQHDRQSRVANSSLAGHIEVVITQDLRVSSVWYEHAWAPGSLCCQSCPTALSLGPCAGCCAPFWNSSLMPCHTCLADCSWAIVQQLQTCRNLLLQPLQEFVGGLLHLLLVRSGIHAFFIVLPCRSGANCAGGGSGMCCWESRKPVYTMISSVILGYQQLYLNLKL